MRLPCTTFLLLKHWNYTDHIFQTALTTQQPLLTFLLALACSNLLSQTISYRITLWGDSVGHMDVRRTADKDGNTVYSIESNSLVKFLWMEKLGHSAFNAVYKNEVLLSCSHNEIENGKANRSTRVSYDGKLYHASSLEKGNKTFTEPPLCSDASIYFADCKNLKRIFYLPDASFYNLKNTAPNRVEFKSADGHRNVYLLDNGLITGTEFHLPLATVYMTKISPVM